MSLVLIILFSIPVALLVLSKIPGVELLVKPIVDILFSLIRLSVENLWMWLIWLFKNLWFAHIEVLQHLVMSAEQLDPSVRMREDE
jgi:hypothetical protein